MLRGLLADLESRGLEREAQRACESVSGPWIERAGRRSLSFLSNDYLGLAQNERWRVLAASSFASFRPSSSASRLAGGWDHVSAQAEEAFAHYFGGGACLFFPSGYQGNLALITGLVRKGQPVFADRRIHASLAHSLAASGADLRPYAHNDMDHLARRLKALQSDCQPIVVTESLFSMDGTVTDTAALAALKERYGFFLLVDEAHAVGCLGEGGRGVFAAYPHLADVVLGTLGKGLGFFGAFALLDAELARALENLSSPVMHSTALPPAHAGACLSLLRLVPELETERKTLRANAAFFRAALAACEIPTLGQAHIVSVPVGNENKAMSLAAALAQAGILALAARSPTVPFGQALLRFSVTALHKKDDLTSAAGALAAAWRRY